MLINQETLRGIVDGSVTLAFRRWKRPTVKAGGNLRTSIGVLAIDAVDAVNEKVITSQDARHAGYGSRRELLAELNKGRDGQLYRIALRYAGVDPRDAMRQQDDLSSDEIIALQKRLATMDRRSSHGPWTIATLQLIAAHPGRRATDLAESVVTETVRFKRNVRKLKELGLTESLSVGYRLSPRGEVVLKSL